MNRWQKKCNHKSIHKRLFEQGRHKKKSRFHLDIFCFRLRGILRKTHGCIPFAKRGVVSLKAPLRGIFHSGTFLTAGWVKTCIIVHDLYAHQGLNSFFQLHQAVDEVLFYSMYILFSPVGYDMFSYTQHSPKL